MEKFKAFLAAAALLLPGCAVLDGVVGEKQQEDTYDVMEDIPLSFAEFSDIPIPDNSSMIMRDTSIFGRDNNWVGTLSYSVPFSVYNTFDFYMAEMPKFGWTEITSVRGNYSVLNFTRRRRVVLIMLEGSGRNETMAKLIMSPAPVNISRGIDEQKKAQTERQVQRAMSEAEASASKGAAAAAQ